MHVSGDIQVDWVISSQNGATYQKEIMLKLMVSFQWALNVIVHITQ